MNAILRLGHFLDQWKVAQIILIPKSGKPHTEVGSYGPILILSKVFEKLLLKRLLITVENDELIPEQHFGFRHMHSTIEQTHRVVEKVNET